MSLIHTTPGITASHWRIRWNKCKYNLKITGLSDTGISIISYIQHSTNKPNNSNTMGVTSHTIHFYSYLLLFLLLSRFVLSFTSLRGHLALSGVVVLPSSSWPSSSSSSKWQRFERQHEINWKRKLQRQCWRRRESNFTATEADRAKLNWIDRTKKEETKWREDRENGA